jgi:hypothetical protein
MHENMHIKEIGVIDQTIANRVNQILTTAPHQPLVQVRAQWYY